MGCRGEDPAWSPDARGVSRQTLGKVDAVGAAAGRKTGVGADQQHQPPLAGEAGQVSGHPVCIRRAERAEDDPGPAGQAPGQGEGIRGAQGIRKDQQRRRALPPAASPA